LIAPTGSGESGIFLGLGSNLGDRRANLASGLRRLRRLGVVPLRCSPIYLSEAVTPSPQPDFLNLVVEVATSVPPAALLTALQGIELALGRPHRRGGGAPLPRTLDIDLLLYRDRILRSVQLTLPHPRLHLRRFVLIPLADLDAGIVVPGTGRTVSSHLNLCEDGAAVIPYLPAPALPRGTGRSRPTP